MGCFLEKHFKGTNFEELVDEESTDFDIASMGLTIDFEAYRDHSIRGLWQRGRTQGANSLRRLWMEDVAHYAHNQIMDWEKTAKRCKEGSDRYIEANNEAYEWLKVARLAERDAVGSGRSALPRMDAATWPI